MATITYPINTTLAIRAARAPPHVVLPVSVSQRRILADWSGWEKGIHTDEDVVYDEEVGANWEGDHGECEGEEFVDYGTGVC
jgi:hypothetical protein